MKQGNCLAASGPGSLAGLGLPFAVLLLLLPLFPLAAQTIGARGERPAAAPVLRTLSVREAVFTSSVTGASAVYRKEAGTRSFALESNEGEAKLEWKIGDEVRPLPEGVKPDARGTEKRIKLIPHEGKLFLKIESISRPEPGEVGDEIRFSGTYEAAVLGGSWEGYLGGGELRLRIAPGDLDRYLSDMKKALFGEPVLARQADAYRKQLLALLEGKSAEPGESSPAEVERIRRILAVVRAHPEALVVSVSPSFDSDPEILVIKGETIRSTTGKQATVLRFDAKLPVVVPRPPGR